MSSSVHLHVAGIPCYSFAESFEHFAFRKKVVTFKNTKIYSLLFVLHINYLCCLYF